MMRRTGQQVKSLQLYDYICHWRISGLEYDEGTSPAVIKTVPHHRDDRETSRDPPPPVTLAGQNAWRNDRQSPSHAGRDRRHKTAAKCRQMAGNLH
jgi:hypothetical protein